MDDDEQQAEPAVWEPWQPQIGQRVRVRANAECPEDKIAPLPDGATGVVSEIERGGRGHRYVVRLDTGDWCGLLRSPCCAALELEPVEWAGGAA